MMIDDTLLRLGSEYSHGYGPSLLPGKIDEEVESLVDAIAADGGEQSAIVLKMSETHGLVLLAYAERMASLAVRRGENAMLEKSMAALRIASALTYVKEALPVLCLLSNSAKKLGVDVNKFFALTTINLKGELKPYIEAFSNRSDEDRSIEAMGYIEGEDEQGFRYLRTW